MKKLSINNNKGFHMTFKNGLTASVQWGLGNYCDNHFNYELGFDGMVMTDYGASNMFKILHRTIEEPVEAGRILCDNEVDMEGCGYFGYCDKFREEVKAGKYPMSKIDRCVKNVLRLKFRLGLFENPYAQLDKVKQIHTSKSVSLAREIAQKGIVLLKNDGVLPLKPEQKVAVIGPNADISQLGNYIYYGHFDKDYSERCVAEESLSLKEVFEREKKKISCFQSSLPGIRPCPDPGSGR